MYLCRQSNSIYTCRASHLECILLFLRQEKQHTASSASIAKQRYLLFEKKACTAPSSISLSKENNSVYCIAEHCITPGWHARAEHRVRRHGLCCGRPGRGLPGRARQRLRRGSAGARPRKRKTATRRKTRCRPGWPERPRAEHGGGRRLQAGLPACLLLRMHPQHLHHPHPAAGGSRGDKAFHFTWWW